MLAAGAVLTVAGCSGPGGGGAAIGGGGDTAKVVASISGQGITRGELQTYAEAKVGPQALQDLIDFKLVAEEAAKRGVAVTDDQLQAALKDQMGNADEQGAAQMASVLAQGGPQKVLLENSMRLRLSLEHLLIKDVKITEIELKSWFNLNKNEVYPPRVSVGMLWTSTQVRADTMTRALKAKSKTFQQLIDEQKKLNDMAAKGSVAEFKFRMSKYAMNENIVKAITALKIGDISPAQKINGVTADGKPGPPAWVIVRLNQSEQPSLEKDRPSIEADFKIYTLARASAKKNNPQDDFKKLVDSLEKQFMREAAMRGQQGSISQREVWKVLLRQKDTDLLTRLRTAGTVEISDPFYKQMMGSYRAAINPVAVPGLSEPAKAPAKAPAKP